MRGPKAHDVCGANHNCSVPDASPQIPPLLDDYLPMDFSPSPGRSPRARFVPQVRSGNRSAGVVALSLRLTFRVLREEPLFRPITQLGGKATFRNSPVTSRNSQWRSTTLRRVLFLASRSPALVASVVRERCRCRRISRGGGLVMVAVDVCPSRRIFSPA